MSNPTITGDSSNVNITNANLVITNDVHANAFFDSSGILVTGGGGGGGGGSTNTTPTEVFPSGGAFTLNMASGSYKTFTANVDQDIDTLTIQNHTAGSQGLLYLTSNSSENITINGKTSGLGGTGVVVGFDDLVLEDTNKAVISFTSDGSNVFTHAVKYPSGAISGIPTLQQVTGSDNSTTNRVILQGGLITGNVLTTANVIDNTLNLDLGGLSYKTFTCDTANSISNVTITGDISGSQGIVFITPTTDITINGTTSGLAGANVYLSYDDMDLSSGQKALLVFTSDGTNRYINAAKYPSAVGGGSQANLHTITNTGNVTTNSITVGDLTLNTNKSAATNSSGTLTVDQDSKSYKVSNVVSSSNITTLSWTNVVTGSQHACTVEASGDLTISNSLGADVKTSFSNVSVTSGNTAVMYMFYDGLKTYVNCIGYN